MSSLGLLELESLIFKGLLRGSTRKLIRASWAQGVMAHSTKFENGIGVNHLNFTSLM